jgi:hypothetical protein
VVRSPAWLKRLEITNWATAYVFLGLTLALFSPVADPARLMVADQMHRLASGATRPDKFDFAALKFDGAGWGAAALERLRHGPQAGDPALQARVNEVLAANNRYQVARAADRPAPADLAKDIEVYPAGRTLPSGFLQSDFVQRNNLFAGVCSRPSNDRCFARYLTLQPGGPEVILLVMGYNTGVFEPDGQGGWVKRAMVAGPTGCATAGLRSGAFTLAPHAAPDIVVGDTRLTLLPFAAPGSGCAPATPAGGAGKPRS